MCYVALVDLEEHRKRNLTTIGARRRRSAKNRDFMHISLFSYSYGDQFSSSLGVRVACGAEL